MLNTSLLPDGYLACRPELPWTAWIIGKAPICHLRAAAELRVKAITAARIAASIKFGSVPVKAPDVEGVIKGSVRCLAAL